MILAASPYKLTNITRVFTLLKAESIGAAFAMIDNHSTKARNKSCVFTKFSAFRQS